MELVCGIGEFWNAVRSGSWQYLSLHMCFESLHFLSLGMDSVRLKYSLISPSACSCPRFAKSLNRATIWGGRGAAARHRVAQPG